MMQILACGNGEKTQTVPGGLGSFAKRKGQMPP
jgi:hypothetical protein